MPEERRYIDLRMDSMETDIREIRVRQDNMQEDITLIREKIFNGMSTKIDETHKYIEDLKDKMGTVEKAVFRSNADRLADCPLKDIIEKKLKFYVGVAVAGFALIVRAPELLDLSKKAIDLIIALQGVK